MLYSLAVYDFLYKYLELNSLVNEHDLTSLLEKAIKKWIGTKNIRRIIFSIKTEKNMTGQPKNNEMTNYFNK